MIIRFLSTAALRTQISFSSRRGAATATTMPVTSYPGLQVTLADGLRIIKFDRPQKKNALSLDMYHYVAEALREAAADPDTHITAITGSGDFYSSGNDLSSMNTMISGDAGDIQSYIKKASYNLRDFVDQFILFPKTLVAVVNGPAIGIAVTTLALVDVAYCSDKATFNTPFVKLAFTPEGCSSVTFPKIMGPSLASEVLLFNRVLNANEALKCGLVSRVESDLSQTVWPYLRKIAKETNPIAMNLGKQTIRQWDKEMLLKINHAELDLLETRWTSEDFFQSIMNYFMKKSKM